MFPLKQNTLRHARFLIKTFKTYRTPQGCKPACLLLGCATPTQGAFLLPAVPGQGRVLPSLHSQPLPTEKEKQPFVCRSAVPFSSCCSLGEQTSLCPLWAYGCGYRHGTALAVAWWPTAARLRFGKMDSSHTSLKAPGECWKAETNGLMCQVGLQTLQTPSSCTMAEGVQEIPTAPIIPQPAPQAERARAAIPAGSREGWMLFDVHLAAIPFFCKGTAGRGLQERAQQSSSTKGKPPGKKNPEITHCFLPPRLQRDTSPLPFTITNSSSKSTPSFLHNHHVGSSAQQGCGTARGSGAVPASSTSCSDPMHCSTASPRIRIRYQRGKPAARGGARRCPSAQSKLPDEC